VLSGTVPSVTAHPMICLIVCWEGYELGSRNCLIRKHLGKEFHRLRKSWLSAYLRLIRRLLVTEVRFIIRNAILRGNIPSILSQAELGGVHSHCIFLPHPQFHVLLQRQSSDIALILPHLAQDAPRSSHHRPSDF
jgi:hypothetical protein